MLEDLYNPDNNQDPIPEDDVNRNYVFADGQLPPSEQLDAFLEEFAEEKEEKNCPTEPTPEELENEDVVEEEEAISNETARNTAEFVVGITDEVASAGLAYLSKDDQESFRAGRNQRKNLENLVTKLCKQKGAEIPLGWQIFGCVATVYGAKIPYAIDRRKLNDEIAEINRQRKLLEEKERELDKQLESARAEREMLQKMKIEQELKNTTN